MEISRLFPGVKLEVVNNVHSANGGRLWLEAILWGAECMSRSATPANAGMMSQNEAYYGSPPELKMLAFFSPGGWCATRSPSRRQWRAISSTAGTTIHLTASRC